MTSHILTGTTEPIQALITADLLPEPGLTDVLLTLRRGTDGFFLDFDDGIFKTIGWTEREHVMAEVDATLAEGLYQWLWDTTGHAEGQYTAMIACVSAHNVPQVCDLHVGGYVDHIDAAITSRQSEMSASARSVANIAEHDDTQTTIAALPVAPTTTAITNALLDEVLAGHLIPGTVGYALLTSLAVPQQNTLLDGGAGEAEIKYDSNGLMTEGRLRVFATRVATLAATPGAPAGADSEIMLITYTGVAHSLYQRLPGTYRGVAS